ncbi:GUN4 domain-containing protein [Thermoleptolyngbya sp. PKUAC-SCTB121]|uniref:GUN4 domain-containing protein n=1 Tax=Thermoleptolyngbya sp. PKUAC-SCTB121 TaxID=2811482 RepID=UPI001964A1CB|nr:GUN4 domain-containing protein [Thermoleptolyngbya sp. PKUAC-SCTB121]
MSSPYQPERNPELKSEPSTEHQFVQKAVNLIIQWSPLGGSLGILAHSILQQNWVIAVLTFPVMLVTVVWAKYTENFTARVGDWAGEKGKRDADSFTSWLDQIDQALRMQLSGFDGKFLKAQSSACRLCVTDNEVPIPLGLTNPDLDDVYVPLQLSRDFFRSRNGEMLPNLPGLQRRDAEALIEAAENRKPFDIWDILTRLQTSPNLRSFAILAWGGYGKTTLLRHLTYCYCTRPHATRRRHQTPEFIPVLLMLRTWRDEIAQPDPPSLPDLITQHHIPKLPGGKNLTIPAAWATRLLHSDRALIMFDGFDEVADEQRVAVSRWIAEQMQTYDRCTFILTSRPNAYSQDYAAERPQLELKVEPFDEDRREKFVKQWYLAQERNAVSTASRNAADVEETADRRAADLLAQIEQRKELADLAKNPLMLSMIAMFHRSLPNSQLPTRRTELYREICGLQLGFRPIAKRIDLLLDAEPSQKILQTLALAMTEQEKTSIAEPDLLTHIAEQLRRLDEAVAPAKWLAQIVQVSELLVKRDEDYEFAHRSFQEYLTAVELKEQQEAGEAQVLEHFTAEFWQNTILLYVSLLQNPSGLIRAACGQGADAIAFAYDCCKMNRRVEDAVKAEVNQLRYGRLENLLATGQWKAADQETFNLMYQTLDRQWTVKGLLNYPCEDLRWLNDLWLNYSNGRFGFSVQKEIYVACGGILDGKYHREAWETFCDRVGWRQEGKYVYYGKLTLDPLHSPDGKLPCGDGCVGFGEVGVGLYLLSHRDL